MTTMFQIQDDVVLLVALSLRLFWVEYPSCAFLENFLCNRQSSLTSVLNCNFIILFDELRCVPYVNDGLLDGHDECAGRFCYR